jgi:hypothetical protein
MYDARLGRSMLTEGAFGVYDGIESYARTEFLRPSTRSMPAALILSVHLRLFFNPLGTLEHNINNSLALPSLSPCFPSFQVAFQPVSGARLCSKRILETLLSLDWLLKRPSIYLLVLPPEIIRGAGNASQDPELQRRSGPKAAPVVWGFPLGEGS